MTNQEHRLYRSRTNKVIAGVCGGIGEYLNMDVTIVRIGWVLLTLLGGSGIIAYIIACFIIPSQPVGDVNSNQPSQSDFTPARIFGIIFVVIGAVLLLDNLDIFSFHRWWDMSEDFVFPCILILFGVYFLAKRKKIPALPIAQAPPLEAEQQSQNQIPPSSPLTEEKEQRKVLRRSLMDKKLLGICGGVGEYFDIDPSIIRIGYVVFTILSGGIGVLFYFLMYLIIPEGQPQPNTQR